VSFLAYAVHYPAPENERQVIDAMRGFAELVRKQRGVSFVDLFKNEDDGTIVSVTLWESRELFQTGWAELVKHAPADEWELRPRQGYALNSV